MYANPTKLKMLWRRQLKSLDVSITWSMVQLATFWLLSTTCRTMHSALSLKLTCWAPSILPRPLFLTLRHPRALSSTSVLPCTIMAWFSSNTPVQPRQLLMYVISVLSSRWQRLNLIPCNVGFDQALGSWIGSSWNPYVFLRQGVVWHDTKWMVRCEWYRSWTYCKWRLICWVLYGLLTSKWYIGIHRRIESFGRRASWTRDDPCTGKLWRILGSRKSYSLTMKW